MLLRTEHDYHEAKQRFEEEARDLLLLERKLRRMCWSEADVGRTLAERTRRQAALGEAIAAYERLRRGEVDPGERDVGAVLVAMRLTLGLSPGEFARALGVSPMFVERGERTGYKSLTTAAAHRMLGALRSMESRAAALGRLLAAADHAPRA